MTMKGEEKIGWRIKGCKDKDLFDFESEKKKEVGKVTCKRIKTSFLSLPNSP